MVNHQDKIYNLTEEQEEQYGAELAKIFKLKKPPGFKHRWQLGDPYFDKTDLGLFRVFVSLVDKINEGRKLIEEEKE